MYGLVNLLNFFSGPLQKGSRISNAGTAQVFIPLIRFLQQSFVSSSFLVLLRYSFLIFSFISPCLMASAYRIPKYLCFLSPSVLILSRFGSSIASITCHLSLFITSMTHFSMPNSTLMSWLYILTVCIRVSSSFSFFANCLMSSMYIRWLIFSCDLLSLYPCVHFLNMWLSGIIAIMNYNGFDASSWNIPLLTFASAKLLPPAVNSTYLVFMFFSIKSTISSDILYILRKFIIQLYGTISYFFIVNPGHS